MVTRLGNYIQSLANFSHSPSSRCQKQVSTANLVLEKHMYAYPAHTFNKLQKILTEDALSV